MAAAAVSVVARDGFDVLSVRSVAREAGLSGGAVQYHYVSRSQLLLAAFANAVQSISDRIVRIDLSGPPPLVLGRLCREALPLDAQRRRECVVWAALSAAAAAHPELAAEHRKALQLLTRILTSAIAQAVRRGELNESVDPAAAAAVLIAVLDGLTLHGIAGSLAPEALTSTMDAAIGMVLQTGGSDS